MSLYINAGPQGFLEGATAVPIELQPGPLYGRNGGGNTSFSLSAHPSAFQTASFYSPLMRLFLLR